jgi:uncharacterized membrane protein YdjX (TVP38/TMEM64 family)
MEMVRKLLTDRRFHRLALVGALLGAGGLLAAWKLGITLADLKHGWQATETYLRGHPWWLFLGLVILPGFPVPTSALLLLAGSVWGGQPVWACAISLLAMALNMTWTYWAAAVPGRGIVERWLATGAFRMPAVPKGNRLRLLLVLRLTPGIPFLVQNYLLGFMRVPFRVYLPVSLACNSMFAVGFVLSGAGIGGGNLTPLMTGVGLIVVAVIAVRMTLRKLKA